MDRIFTHITKTIAATFIGITAFLSIFLSSYSQAIQSPTPDLDGRILYTIKEGDTCLALSMLYQVDNQTIISLNNLDENCTLTVGTQILLGMYATPTPTPGPSPTPTLVTPSPTPYSGNGSVCIYLFEDVNGNSIAEETEQGIVGGAISLTKRNGSENFTGLTTGNELLCFPTVPEGDYNVSVAPPPDYNPTTNMNYPLVVKAGDNTQVNFGAQKSAAIEDIPTDAVQGRSRSPMMAMVGILFVIAGVAIVIIFGIFKRRN